MSVRRSVRRSVGRLVGLSVSQIVTQFSPLLPAVAVPIDESVVIQKGANPGDPTEITINCPDKVGLGCDLARTIFEFGLSVVKGGQSHTPLCLRTLHSGPPFWQRKDGHVSRA